MLILFDLTYFNKQMTIIHSGYQFAENDFMILENPYNKFHLTNKQKKYLEEKITKMNRKFIKYGTELINYYTGGEMQKEIAEKLRQYQYFENGTIYQ